MPGNTGVLAALRAAGNGKCHRKHTAHLRRVMTRLW